MQNENKMEWWLSFVSVLTVVTAILTLAFSVTAFMIANDAGKNAENTAATIQDIAKDISITVKSDPVVIRQPDTAEHPDSSAPSGNQPVSAAPEETTVRFFLREYNGKIGVFSADGGLLKTVPVTVASLPETDRDALRDGIGAADSTELEALLEDLS